MNGDHDTESPYAALRERALDYLRSRNERVSEEELIRFLFGATTKPALWSSLFRTVMSGDHRFVETFAGHWSLASEPVAISARLQDFVAIDVETTGLKPYEHRVIEIGLARYQNNRCVERYTSLVNPERRLPGYIVKLTGLTDSDLVSAPRFSQISGEVLQFIGDSTLLGHNIGFDVGFLNAELERARLTRLGNPTIDTIPMAMHVLGRRVRPSLDRVAAAVGMARSGRHRALADAELTSEVALRLWSMAIQSGHDPHELIAACSNRRTVDRPFGSSSAVILDRQLLATLPSTPGVYIMVDAQERILYVGKAKSIRDRVASYYAQPLGYTRKMDGLIEQIRRIDHEETGSELQALLLEAQLIRRHQPPYNRMLRNSETYPFIRIDPANNWPALRLAKNPRPDGARYFGPYRSRSTARDAIELLNRRFQLRSCGRGFKSAASYGNPCLELDLKHCGGPCVGKADAVAYRTGVREVIAFLEGGGAKLLGELQEQIAAAVEETRYEEAQRIRMAHDVLERLHREQSALAEMKLSAPYLIILPAPTAEEFRVMMIIEGQWWSSVRVEQRSSPAEIVSRLADAWERYRLTGVRSLDSENVDDANIIARWRKQAGSQPAIIHVHDPERPDWSAIAEAVVSFIAGQRQGGAELAATPPQDQDHGLADGIV